MISNLTFQNYKSFSATQNHTYKSDALSAKYQTADNQHIEENRLLQMAQAIQDNILVMSALLDTEC